MVCKTTAQSLLEYLVIAIVVVSGIFIGGPFLVNSINAKFRGMSNAARDASFERIGQGAVPTITAPGCYCVPPVGSSPTTWTPGACGQSSCSETDRFYSRFCSCTDIYPTQACVPDNSCCGGQFDNKCGTRFEDGAHGSIPGCVSRNSLPSGISSSDGFEGTCSGSTQDCAIGEAVYRVVCGSGSTAGYACKDDLNCLPACWGSPSHDTANGDPHSNPCPDDDIPATLINELKIRTTEPPPQQWGIFGLGSGSYVNKYKVFFRYRSSCDTQSPDRKCERTCNPGYYPICL